MIYKRAILRKSCVIERRIENFGNFLRAINHPKELMSRSYDYVSYLGNG